MKRIIALVLVLLGAAGLILGRLGETTWAPDTERTATVQLKEPGSAVIIDPGVLYVGGTEGTATITADGDVSLITASNDDITAYLGGAHHTRITGLSDWQTLTTEDVNASGEAEIPDPVSSDLWRSVETTASPATIDVADFHRAETETASQPFRAILLVTDGTAPGATSVSITWPVDARNDWVPYAYAAGAAVAVIGLVLLVVSLSSGRRRDEEDEAELHDTDQASVDADAVEMNDADAIAGREADITEPEHGDAVAGHNVDPAEQASAGAGPVIDTDTAETDSTDARTEDEHFGDAWSVVDSDATEPVATREERPHRHRGEPIEQREDPEENDR